VDTRHSDALKLNRSTGRLSPMRSSLMMPFFACPGFQVSRARGLERCLLMTPDFISGYFHTALISGIRLCDRARGLAEGGVPNDCHELVTQAFGVQIDG